MNSKTSAQSINWRQAIAEMALIIAGVLIALGVDAWWDQRQVAKAEVSYLEALLQDFETNRDDLLNQIQIQEDIIASGDKILKKISAGLEQESSSEFFSELSNELYFFRNWTPVTGTYDNIIASGQLLYIENQNLRSELTEFQKSLDHVRRMEDLQSRTFYDRQSPFLEKNQDAAYSTWSQEYRPPTTPFEVDIAPFASLEFWNLVIEWIFVHSDVISQYRSAITRCEQIIELIDAELTAKRG